MIPKKEEGQKAEQGIGADGVDAQNTRLEVQHNFKEVASRGAT